MRFKFACDLAQCEYILIPVRTDGSKKPLKGLKWSRFYEKPPTNRQLRKWCSKGYGLAAISTGKLVRIDIERFEDYERLVEEISRFGDKLQEWLSVCPKVRTPGHSTDKRGGIHIYFFDESGSQRSTVLAASLQGDKWRARIEWKARGTYTILPGSPATCHPTGRTYELIEGDLTKTPSLPDKVIRVLKIVCSRFDERIRKVVQPRRERPYSTSPQPHDLREETERLGKDHPDSFGNKILNLFVDLSDPDITLRTDGAKNLLLPCPLCQRQGGDTTGNNLVISYDGKKVACFKGGQAHTGSSLVAELTKRARNQYFKFDPSKLIMNEDPATARSRERKVEEEVKLARLSFETAIERFGMESPAVIKYASRLTLLLQQHRKFPHLLSMADGLIKDFESERDRLKEQLISAGKILADTDDGDLFDDLYE